MGNDLGLLQAIGSVERGNEDLHAEIWLDVDGTFFSWRKSVI
jgi:hypothetical protein